MSHIFFVCLFFKQATFLERIWENHFQKQDASFFLYYYFLEILSRINPQYRYIKNIIYVFQSQLKKKKSEIEKGIMLFKPSLKQGKQLW